MQIGYSGEKDFVTKQYRKEKKKKRRKRRAWNDSFTACGLLPHSLARQHQTIHVFLKSISDPQHPSAVPRETAGMMRLRRFDTSEEDKGEVRCEHTPSSVFWCTQLFCSQGCSPHAPNPPLNQFHMENLWPWPQHWSRRQEVCIHLPALTQALWVSTCRSQLGDLISLSYSSVSTDWKQNCLFPSHVFPYLQKS